MNMTPALKAWLIKEGFATEKSTDVELLVAAATAMGEKKLSPEQYKELAMDPKAARANEFQKRLDMLATNLEKAVAGMTNQKSAETLAAERAAAVAAATVPSGTKDIHPPTSKFLAAIVKMSTGEESEISVRVKGVKDMYSGTKTALAYPTTTKDGKGHPLAGQPVRDFSMGDGDISRTLNSTSDLEKACAGAFAQWHIACLGHSVNNHSPHCVGSKRAAFERLPQHQKDLLLYAINEMEWCGYSGSDKGYGGSGRWGVSDKESEFADILNRKLYEGEKASLIDDAISGGTESVPIVFDDMIVTTPILHGELFPLVNLIPLDRGRRIQGARAGIVTSSWGGVDDSQVLLFDTASYVSAFDTTIYRWQGAISIGLDFLSDTPIDFAQFVTNQYGEVMLRDLDTVCAIGDGTTQPQGVMNKSGTTSVAFGGVTSNLGNWEALRFSVHKRELSAQYLASAVFCSTDITYYRTMATPVGTTDARRLFTTYQLPNYQGYSWMGHPFKISGATGQSSPAMTNAQAFFAVMGRYRMYRRRGLVMRNSVEGDSLLRRNEMLLVAMARFGGQLERGACAAVTSTAQA